jgi:hypothetical protein
MKEFVAMNECHYLVSKLSIGITLLGTSSLLTHFTYGSQAVTLIMWIERGQ